MVAILLRQSMHKKNILKRVSVIPDTELEQLERELGSEPPPSSKTSLEIVWDDFMNKPGTQPGDELVLADLQGGKLYSVYAQPATGVSGNRIVIYPIVQRYERDYSRAETFEASPDGSFNWEDITSTYFPAGFDILEKEKKEEVVTGSKKTPDDFWRKVLANLLQNFSAKDFYEKRLDNPYLIKRNKQ
jgi:hypothetical protein